MSNDIDYSRKLKGLHIDLVRATPDQIAEALFKLDPGKAAQVTVRLVKLLGPAFVDTVRERGDRAVAEATENPMCTVARVLTILAEHAEEEDTGVE